MSPVMSRAATQTETDLHESAADAAGAPASGAQPIASRRPRPTLWQRAVYRWTAITTVLAALLLLYTQHPYYQEIRFQAFRPVFTGGFVLWLVLGVFYVRATLKRFPEQRYMMRDGGLHLILMGRALVRGRLSRVIRNPRVRTTVLGIFVKGFFTPLMTGFVAGHMTAIMNHWMHHKHLPNIVFNIPQNTGVLVQATAWFKQLAARIPDFAPAWRDFAGLFAPAAWTAADLRWGFDLGYDVVFFVDCGFALMGYACESRWLGNKTRSVEPTGLGWVVCLACYPPFNNVTGTYLPLRDGAQWITSADALLAMRGMTVLLFAIYASATASFGFKFSNLTHRGVVSRGPYRLLRHPAYVCKCLAWWLEHLPTMTLTKAFFLTALCGVYALRAFTEERHLGRDPAYLEYKKKVPWVLVPGVY